MTKETQSWLLLAFASAIVAGLTLWRMGLMPSGAPDVPHVLVPEISVPLEESADAELSAPRYPLEPSAAHPLASGEIARALTNLLGKDGVAAFVQTEDFPRRFVATIDNLGRSHAPHVLWPVSPTPEPFKIDDRGGRPVIALDNMARYTPFVLMAETINASRAVGLYARMYPLLPRAYEELGYPNGHFNDRFVAVIDLLLATPEVDYPVALHLTEVKGPIPSLRPWVRYEFADPALENLSAGQKVLLRMGLVNQRRLKQKLVEVRTELLKRAPAR